MFWYMYERGQRNMREAEAEKRQQRFLDAKMSKKKHRLNRRGKY